MDVKIHIFRNKGHVCIKCKYPFTEEEIENGEVGEVLKGPVKGRVRVTLVCPKCYQRKIIIKGVK